MPIRPENRGRYPKDWKAISARIRFERAQGRCECTGQCGQDHGGRCDAVHGDLHPQTGSVVVLTTMHLNHQPEDCDDANLLAGCQRCHNRYDMPMRRAGVRERRDMASGQKNLFALMPSRKHGGCHLPLAHLHALSDADYARAVYRYRDGGLYWRIRTSHSVQVGERAGRVQPVRGYREVRFRGRLVKEHRLIWLIMKGHWPRQQIDHIDGDPQNNRIENLRDVSGGANSQNLRKPRSGRFVGVSRRHNGRFQASIGIGGRVVYLGIHETEEAAREAYLAAKAELHPDAPADGQCK